MWQRMVWRRSPPSASMVSRTRWPCRSQPGRWIDSGTPERRDAPAAPRSTFSSSAVKSLLMPISPMMPAATIGMSSATPPQSRAIAVGDLVDRHGAHVVGMRRLEIEAGAHDDVEAGAAADLLQGGGIAADAEIGGIDHRPPAEIDEFHQLLDRHIGVEQLAVVAIEEGIHPELAEHGDVDRPLGEADLAAQHGPPPPTRRVEEQMLVHQRDAHLLDRNLAEDGHHLPGMDADVRLALSSVMVSRPCLPVRKMRKFSQMAMRMIAPVTIGARNGETWERISPLPITATVSAAEQRAGHRAATAEQAGAAEHDGGDHVELEADTGVGRAAAEPGGDDDAGQRRRDAADHIDQRARRGAC